MAVDDVILRVDELDLSAFDFDPPEVHAAFAAEARILLARGPLSPGGEGAATSLGTAVVSIDDASSAVDLGRQLARGLVGQLRRGWIPPR